MTILYKLTVCALQILVFSKPHLVYHYCLRARRSLGQNNKLGLYWSWLACVQFPCGYSCFVPHFKCVNSCLSLLALTGSAPLQPWTKLDGCFSELGDQSWYNIWLCTYTHTHLCSILENEGFSIWEASLSFGLHCSSLYCLLLVQLFLGSSQPPVLASLWDSEFISKSSCLFSHSWFNSFLHLWPLRALWCSRSLQSDRQMFQTVPQSRVKLRHFLPPNCGTAFQH